LLLGSKQLFVIMFEPYVGFSPQAFCGTRPRAVALRCYVTAGKCFWLSNNTQQIVEQTHMQSWIINQGIKGERSLNSQQSIRAENIDLKEFGHISTDIKFHQKLE
jgi:hypothetical protein